MLRTGQLRALVGAGLASLVVGVLLACSASAALPPNLTDTFDSGDDGWSIYKGGSIGPVDWNAGGGNPGGFLSYTTDGAGSDAAFGDAEYVAHLSRYSGRARIVADMRTSAVGAAPPTISLADPDYPAMGSIHATAGTPLSPKWQSYSFPLVAETGWYDDAGDRLDAGDLHRFLNLDPVVLVGAAYGSAAGSITDLDNIGIIDELPRAITIAAKRRSFTGRVSLEEGFDAPQCLDDQKVRVLRLRKGGTRLFGKARTDSAGRYKVKGKPKPGRYVAEAPLNTNPDPDCAAAKSKAIKVPR